MKKFLMAGVAANFLFLAFATHAMSPGQIAEKQKQFRQQIAIFKGFNRSRKGFSLEALDAEKAAQKIINEIKDYTDVKWMEMALETEVKDREEDFGLAAHTALGNIANALGTFSDAKGSHFTRGVFSLEGAQFYKKLTSNILQDLKKASENRLKGTTDSLLYMLNNNHQDFIDFANIFGKSNKSFYAYDESQDDVFDTIKNDVAILINKLYYRSQNKEEFGRFKNTILARPSTSKNTLEMINQLKEKNLGGILYHLNKDLKNYKNLMDFAGGDKDALNIPMAIDKINEVANQYDLQEPFTKKGANAKDGDNPITFDNLIQQALQKGQRLWSDSLATFLGAKNGTVADSGDAALANIKDAAKEQLIKSLEDNDTIWTAFEKTLEAGKVSGRSNHSDSIKKAAMNIFSAQESVFDGYADKIVPQIVTQALQPIKDAIITLVKSTDGSKENKSKQFMKVLDGTGSSFTEVLYKGKSEKAILDALTDIVQKIEKIDMLKFKNEDFGLPTQQ